MLLEGRYLVHGDFISEPLDACQRGDMVKELVYLKDPVKGLYLDYFACAFVFFHVEVDGWVAEIAEVWNVVFDAGSVQGEICSQTVFLQLMW